MPRPRKNVNTFAGYQDEKQNGRKILIEAYLAALKESRARFDYVTDLAKMVATHITRVEQAETKCFPSTLLRNLGYKALLMSYMADEPLPGAKNQVVSQSDMGIEAQTKIIQLQLSNRNLSSENERLKGHLASIKEVEVAEAVRGPVVVDGEVTDFEEKYILTCQALWRLLENFDELVSVEVDSKRIIDLARRTNNVIVDERLSAPFIEWLLANRTR